MNLQPPPGFPVCAEQQPGETIPEYAARVLRFLLSCGTTASLSTEQLEHADHAAATAIVSIKGTDGRASTAAADPTSARLLIILSAARTTAQSALAWRRDAAKRAAQAPASPPTGGQQPGRPAPLQPPTPDLPPGSVALDPLTRRRQPDGIRF